jgi:hypothetical protein
MRIKATMLLAAAVAVAGIAAGCGGGDDNSDTTTTSLTKAAWIAKADAICKAGNDQINATAKQQFGNKKPTAAQIQQFTENTVIPNTADQIDKIKSLGTPTEQGGQADAVINSAEATINRVKADPSLLTGKSDPFAQTDQLAKAYGMKVCGQG